MSEIPYYASFGRRLVAAFLDVVVLGFLCVVAGHLIPIAGGLIVFFLYAPVLECSELRATLGKYWVGIQVSDPQGHRISIQSALLRNFLKVISTVLLFLGCLVALFNREKRTLHDLLANTVVVYGRNEQSMWAAWSDSVRDSFSRARRPSNGLSDLERLQKLKEKGALTDEEFQSQKRLLLNLHN